jgi:hypothetical protein
MSCLAISILNFQSIGQISIFLTKRLSPFDVKENTREFKNVKSRCKLIKPKQQLTTLFRSHFHRPSFLLVRPLISMLAQRKKRS